jgi:hypothetical protein
VKPGITSRVTGTICNSRETLDKCGHRLTLEAEVNFSRLAQFAAVTAAFVIGPQAKSATPLSYGNYYDERVSINCGSSVYSCQVAFSQTPSNKLVLIRKVHCNFNSTVPLSWVTLFIGTTPGDNPLSRELPLQFLPSHPGTAAQSDGNYRYTVDVTTQFLIGQSRFPFIAGTTNYTIAASMSGNCTLIGDLVTPI